MIRERVGIHPDPLVCRLYVRSFERRLADYKCVNDDS